MILFSAGRDHKFRPVIYLYPTRVQSHMIQNFQYFLNVYLAIIQKHVFKSYYLENWVMIIDVEKKGVLNFPYKALKSMIDTADLHFSSRLHKTFIVNPSFIFNTAWTVIKGFIDPETTRKMSVLKKKDFGHILDVIPKSQLLKPYGGDLDVPATAFPIMKTLKDDAIPKMLPAELLTNNYIPDKLSQLKSCTPKNGTKHPLLTEIPTETHSVSADHRLLRFHVDESYFSKEMTRISSMSFSRPQFT